MKIINYFLILSICFIVGCSTNNTATKSNTLTIEGTSNLVSTVGTKVYLEKVGVGPNVPLENQELSKEGTFSFQVPMVGMEKEIFRIRINNKVMFLSNEDDSKKMALNIDMNNNRQANYTVEGSPASSLMASLYGKIMGLTANANDFKMAVEGNYPYGTAYLSYKYLMVTPATLPIHNLAISKLNAAFPGHALINEYQSYINKKTAAMPKGGGAGNTVKVGQQAPDITLPNPQGEIMKLSSLKGKVVVVDFWASWCGPCRKFGNPKLVELHKKYKNEDFAIFNVALERGKDNKRWEDAIKKDGLVWPHQVVDRERKFSPVYGATRIPRVYLIDKEGKLAAINPRGAELENKIKALLKT